VSQGCRGDGPAASSDLGRLQQWAWCSSRWQCRQCAGKSAGTFQWEGGGEGWDDAAPLLAVTDDLPPGILHLMRQLHRLGVPGVCHETARYLAGVASTGA
jgi:hypothetical protein